jgi:benzoyl-CoA reductase/2-hydroxyglutaryl-CoA dehydratase subunit BcrC/BadD/HgdB
MTSDAPAATGQRSRKTLASTAVANAYQKQFGLELRRRVVEDGEPFAIVQADTPHEIFHAMDIPIIANQWWSAYISAKQLSARYFQVMAELGYPQNSCKYCSLGLACTLANDPATAPWGGLPTPTVMVARLTCDCIQHVFQQWAEATGSIFFPMEAPAWEHKDRQWFRHSNTEWEQVFEPRRIEMLVTEMRDLIALLEERTGRRFDEARLMDLMERINEQEGYLWEANQALARARPCPVSIGEQMSTTMVAQWHRGSDWAVAHARRFRDEVMERIAAGTGAASQEKVRLMWIGAGVTHVQSFYQALDARHGALILW